MDSADDLHTLTNDLVSPALSRPSSCTTMPCYRSMGLQCMIVVVKGANEKTASWSLLPPPFLYPVVVVVVGSYMPQDCHKFWRVKGAVLLQEEEGEKNRNLFFHPRTLGLPVSVFWMATRSLLHTCCNEGKTSSRF